MNSVMPSLKFTLEIGEDFEENKLPTLDLRLWVVDGRNIMFDFYEKPMASNTVIHAKTAQSLTTKLSTLTQEVVRRLLHTCRDLDYSHRVEALEKLSQKMINSGHHSCFIKRVMMSGICKYERKVRSSQLERKDPAFRPLYLSTRYDELGRWKKRVMEKEEWYLDKEDTAVLENNVNMHGGRNSKKKKTLQQDGGVKTSTVMFVPSSKGGILLQKMREAEEHLARLTGFRIRFQESGGTTLASLFSTDLAKGMHCGRKLCHTCNDGEEKKPACKAQSVLYESKCMECNKVDVSSHQGSKSLTDLKNNRAKVGSREGIYFGETSRSLFERVQEHHKDAEDFSAGSHIIKHWTIDHPDMVCFQTIYNHKQISKNTLMTFGR